MGIRSPETAAFDVITWEQDPDRIIALLEKARLLAAQEKGGEIGNLLEEEGVPRMQYFKWLRMRPEIEARCTKPISAATGDTTPAETEAQSADAEGGVSENKGTQRRTRDEEFVIAKGMKEAQLTGKRGAVAAFIRSIPGLQPWQAYDLRRKYAKELGDPEDVTHLQGSTRDEILNAIDSRLDQIKGLCEQTDLPEYFRPGLEIIRLGVKLNREAVEDVVENQPVSPNAPEVNGQPAVPVADQPEATVERPAAAPPAPQQSPRVPAAQSADAQLSGTEEQQRQMRVIQWAAEQRLVDGNATYDQAITAIVASYKKLTQKLYGTWRTGLDLIDRDWEKLQQAIDRAMAHYLSTLNPLSKTLDRNKVREDMEATLMAKRGPIQEAVWKINRGLFV